LLLVEILESWRPERMTIRQSSGHSILDETALGTVERWTFIPVQREGQPVRSFAEVPIVFSLRKESLQRRVVILPRGALLVRVGEVQQSRFIERAADELQPDRQAVT
jgi:TonB family protein